MGFRKPIEHTNDALPRDRSRDLDPGHLPRTEVDGWIEHIKKEISPSFFEEIMLAGRAELGVFSLSETCTSALLWSHYADSHRGFCVELTPSADQEDPLLYASRVAYTVDRPILSPFDVQFSTSEAMSESTVEKLVLTKSKDWEYEKECRVIASVPGGYKALRPGAVAGVYLGAAASEELETRLRSLVRDRSPQPRFYRMRLHDEHYSMEADPL